MKDEKLEIGCKGLGELVILQNFAPSFKYIFRRNQSKLNPTIQTKLPKPSSPYKPLKSPTISFTFDTSKQYSHKTYSFELRRIYIPPFVIEMSTSITGNI